MASTSSGTAPQDPRLSTEEYLAKHQLNELLEGLLADVLINKPVNPAQYVVAQLEKIKVAGTKPVLSTEDLSAMWGMFDVTGQAAVTEQQASNALRTVLGQRAPKPGVDAATTVMCKQHFLSYMQTSLALATPLCQGSGSTEDS